MKPLVIGRGFLPALAVQYGLYALWGVAAFLTGIIPIHDLSGFGFSLAWSGVVAIVSGILSMAVIRRLERTEIITTWFWLCTVALYPIALIVQWFGGDLGSPHIIFIALAYLVIPSWRLSFLLRKTA